MNKSLYTGQFPEYLCAYGNIISSTIDTKPYTSAICDKLTNELIKESLECGIKDLEGLINLIGERGLQNEQWCLNILDKLNELSVKY